MANLDLVLSKLRNVKPSNGGHVASCPSSSHKHNDDKPSLSVTMGNKGGIVLHCFVASCQFAQFRSKDDVKTFADLIGVTLDDLMPPRTGVYTPPTPKPKAPPKPIINDKPKPTIVSTIEYPAYTDPEGNPAHIAIRKNFSDGSKTYTQKNAATGEYSLKGCTTYPYRLKPILDWLSTVHDMDDILGIKQGDPDYPETDLYIVEGEKSALRLAELDIQATTNAGGAGHWKDEYTAYFAGVTRVILLADNDPAGEKHIEVIGRSFKNQFPDVKLIAVRFTDMREKADVYDWLEAHPGTTRDQFFEMITARATVYEPPKLSSEPPEVPPPDDSTAPPPEEPIKVKPTDVLRTRLRGYYESRLKGQYPGLTTGIVPLDEITLGLEPDDILIFTAPAGVGKTSFSIMVALHIIEELKIRTPGKQLLIMTTEMTASSYTMRFLSYFTGKETNSIRGDGLEPEFYDEWVDYIDSLPIVWVDSTKLDDLLEATKRTDIGCVLVDSVTKVSTGAGDAIYDRTVKVAQALQTIAKSLIPVIGTGHSNRAAGDKPDLYATKGGGDWEELASILATAERPDEATQLVKMKVRKYRHGNAGRPWSMRIGNRLVLDEVTGKNVARYGLWPDESQVGTPSSNGNGVYRGGGR